MSSGRPRTVDRRCRIVASPAVRLNAPGVPLQSVGGRATELAVPVTVANGSCRADYPRRNLFVLSRDSCVRGARVHAFVRLRVRVCVRVLFVRACLRACVLCVRAFVRLPAYLPAGQISRQPGLECVSAHVCKQSAGMGACVLYTRVCAPA